MIHHNQQVLETVSVNLSELTPAEFEDLLKELHIKASEAVKEAVAAQDNAASSIKSNCPFFYFQLFIKLTTSSLLQSTLNWSSSHQSRFTSLAKHKKIFGNQSSLPHMIKMKLFNCTYGLIFFNTNLPQSHIERQNGTLFLLSCIHPLTTYKGRLKKFIHLHHGSSVHAPQCIRAKIKRTCTFQVTL